MSLPAAATPLAVLVLAWDETTPAARVLVEPADFAAPALDSVAVLIPTAPPGATLTQEEFLPLPASPALLAPAPALSTEETASPAPAEVSSPAAETVAPIEAEEATASHLHTRTPIEALTLEANSTVVADPLPEAALLATATADPNAPPLPTAEATTAAALVGPALVWQEVRVLHFASPAPLMLVWEGAPATPAAPYLGSSVAVAAALETSEAQGSAVAAALLAGAGSAASALGALRGPELPDSEPATVPAATPPPAYLLAELPAAPDAESDATPAPDTDESVLPPHASITELSEAAASPADGLTVDASAVQAESAQPAAPTETAETTPPAAQTPLSPAAELAAPATSSLDALHPAGQPFDAPNLNFQIIQYARRAVPQALAEQPFGVIYAPAWPTWLAAQELRHRTGQPLVLHLAQLAAAEDELIDLAAGWVAEIQRQGLHRADLILTETPALAQRLRRELALPAYRVRAVSAADAAAVAQALGGVVRG